MNPRAWYRFVNAAADPTVVELVIFSDIGTSWYDDDAVSAKQFMADLQALPATIKTILVRVNSLGGDVYDAVAIANALRDQSRSKGRTVHTIVEGIAASAASIVIMAGETIQIADNGLIMVHEPWTIEMGNAAVMRKTADMLDRVRDTSIVVTYQWHSTLTAEAIVALMAAETWMNADEAIANGFATEKIEGLKAAASLDRRALAKLTVPEPYRARVDALLAPPPAPPPPAPVAAAATEVLRLCREGDVLDLAEGLITGAATLDDARAAITTARTTRTQAATRATEIRALCTAAKQPELADGYIAGAMTADAVRAHLTVITAKLDAIEIDGSLLPDRGAPGAKTINTAAIYAARNRPN